MLVVRRPMPEQLGAPEVQKSSTTIQTTRARRDDPRKARSKRRPVCETASLLLHAPFQLLVDFKHLLSLRHLTSLRRLSRWKCPICVLSNNSRNAYLDPLTPSGRVMEHCELTGLRSSFSSYIRPASVTRFHPCPKSVQNGLQN